MRIMTDIDGCIGDFCAMASDFMGINNLPEPDAFDLFKASGWKEYFPTAKVFEDFYIDLVKNSQYLLEPANSEAIEALNRLRSNGNTIVVATHRGFKRLVGTPAEWVNKKAYDDTAAWLRKIGLQFDELIFTKHKTDAKANVYIDDSPQNIREIKSLADPTAVMIKQIYNTDCHEADLVTDNWDEVYRFISELSHI